MRTRFGVSGRAARAAALAVVLWAGPASGLALAQAAQRLAVDLAGGQVLFADDGIVGELMVAGAARYYVSPRLSLGPEIVGISGYRHSHRVLTGNLTFDLRSLSGGRVPRTAPFLVAGGGVFQTREQLFTGPYASTEGAFTLGGGVRWRAGERGHVGVEARMGWEAHVRLNAVAGFRLGT